MTMRFYFAGTAYDARSRAHPRRRRDRAAPRRRCPAHTRPPSRISCRSTIRADRMHRPRSKDARSTRARSRRCTTPAWPAAGPRRSIVRLVAGRTFYEHELQTTAPVALVNRQLARDVLAGRESDRPTVSTRRRRHPHRGSPSSASCRTSAPSSSTKAMRRRRPRTCRTGSSRRATTASSFARRPHRSR